jgi:hypothetical protein
MADQQQVPYPAQYSPAPRPISVAYRRWATALVWIAVVVLAFVVVASVASIIMLNIANADTTASAYGYLAIVLWVLIMAAVPVLLGTGITGLVMRARVRRTPQGLGGTAA